MNKKTKIPHILGTFILFTILLIISELIYQLKNNPKHLANLYFKNFQNIPLSNNPGMFRKQLYYFTTKSLYLYLSKVDSILPDVDPCIKVCLSYEEEQTYLELFKKLLSGNSLNSLNNNQKANIYFWMATFNIWHNDDQRTLEWLEKGLSLTPNERYQEFYSDLKRISAADFDIANQNYFTQKLSLPEEKFPGYQRIYFAKASHKLTLANLNSNDLPKAKKYAQKSTTLNPWNTEYYLVLSEIYARENDSRSVEKTLNECINKIPKDSQLCEEKLKEIQQ